VFLSLSNKSFFTFFGSLNTTQKETGIKKKNRFHFVSFSFPFKFFFYLPFLRKKENL